MLVNYFLAFIVIFSTNVFAATDWSAKLNSFVIKKYTLPAEKIKSLPLPEAKAEVKKSITGFYKELDLDYKSKLNLAYSPFGSKWQLGRIDMELNPFTTMDQIISGDFENKINKIINDEYKDFISSEYLISNHKVFDHETEIFNLKKEIIFLNQQIAFIKKDIETSPAPPAREKNDLPYYLLILTFIASAGVSFLICLKFRQA